MELYNTLTRRVEHLAPDGESVRMYVCGVTPYDTTHLGHARTYVVFDVLHRYLSSIGSDVHYIQNITDVDEPLFRKARQLGVSYQSLAADNVARYFADMTALHVLPAARYPKAGDHIPDMIQVIAGLIRNGLAYQRAGAVFFRVSSDPGYGALSRLSPDAMAAANAAHGDDPADSRKESPLDFTLWRTPMDDEPSWPSPWGDGLPGWHIECSTMALKYLGPRIDIHGGGDDLIFPHHENEIAQSEGFTGERPFSRFWLHVGMVRLDGVKMSKSLGNLVMARDLLRRFSPAAIRLYLLGYPYRDAFDYDQARLIQAQALADKLQLALRPSLATGHVLDSSPFRDRFLAALANDLRTPDAIAALTELAEAIERAMQGGRDVAPAKADLRDLTLLLGLGITQDRSASR